MIRLLKCLPGDDGFELASFDDDLAPPYAILSHTWIEGQEVTYSELLAGSGVDKGGYKKIRFCGEQATADDLEYFWIDTCCIDKSNSVELSTAINSMFRWYQHASKCYVYLIDVSVPQHIDDAQASRAWEPAFRQSRWFTRGWTLQELLAPTTIKFFSVDGKLLGNKVSLEQEIHDITSIPINALRGQNLADFGVSERMNWVAKRTTKWKEDKVYCLLGIFGVFLPLNYGEGEEYATQRLRDEIQKRQHRQTQTHLQDLPVSLSLPFTRNELFVGRESQLQAIEQTLLSRSTHQRMTIYGLGGCGKSALAIEFAYRALATNAIHQIFWVPAMSRESVELAFREIAIRLNIPGISDGNANLKQLVRDTLSSRVSGDWLMIVDNADDPSILLESDSEDPRSTPLIDYIPHSDEGAILFTTRSRKAAIELSQNYVLPLDDMGGAEARQLLLHRTTNNALLDDEPAINELLEMLTYLPLAIVQAAAFMNQNDVSVARYVSLLQHASTEAELFSERFEDPSRYQRTDSTVARTWYISFEHIRRQDPLAADYLSFIACIDRTDIPQSLLPPGNSRVQHTKALGTLTGYAFLTERQQTIQGSGKESYFHMHRLVHMALSWWLEAHSQRKAWVDIAVLRVTELLLFSEWVIWGAYLPHAIHVVGLEGARNSLNGAALLGYIGRSQQSIGQYAAAVIAYRESWCLMKEMLGHEHPDTLQCAGNLGWALEMDGKYDDAVAIHYRTLESREKVLGRQHPNTLIGISQLGSVLSKQAKFKEAEKMLRRALAGKEKVIGREHPETIASVGQLGTLLERQGKYKDAEKMIRRALEGGDKILGRDHPETLTCLSRLGSVLERQGKYENAEAIQRQALEIRERILGQEHPATLSSAGQLGMALMGQKNFEEAEVVVRRALEGFEKIFGREHPDTLLNVYSLALILEQQHRNDESLALYQWACAGFSATLGDTHQTTKVCHEDYADLKGKLELSKKKGIWQLREKARLRWRRSTVIY
ncbi:kinesin light chain 1 [Paraphaeosphaeria sporulosa]|uniref:Kinesin light chain 1 n=1 Tax=Paraphaeosphaeria sporulosa TaxID=1460663 RepID=A0A177BVA5_9PLEO|nr:kinesin light chain 1 [Paraphaeosphaeria sporulosa]OAF99085.1 kinesin light chain 1 [Paraphaeosphaeria sporulosa]